MEHRGSRYEDDDERRREFERGREGRRSRGEAYSGGYYGGGRSDWRERPDPETREGAWEREGPRDRARGRDERNFMDRVTDEVRSWFGDEEAERRRRQDFRDMYGREGHDERDRRGHDRTWTGERAPYDGRGPYYGRGPRGYQRSDDRIREDVCERFSEHGMLDASDVEVIVAGDRDDAAGHDAAGDGAIRVRPGHRPRGRTARPRRAGRRVSVDARGARG